MYNSIITGIKLCIKLPSQKVFTMFVSFKKITLSVPACIYTFWTFSQTCENYAINLIFNTKAKLFYMLYINKKIKVYHIFTQCKKNSPTISCVRAIVYRRCITVCRALNWNFKFDAPLFFYNNNPFINTIFIWLRSAMSTPWTLI